MIIGGSLEKSALENKPIIYIKQNANQENFRWTREESQSWALLNKNLMHRIILIGSLSRLIHTSQK